MTQRERELDPQLYAYLASFDPQITMSRKEWYVKERAAKDEEKDRILRHFRELPQQLQEKADAADGDVGLVWAAAAASVRRCLDEAEQRLKRR